MKKINVILSAIVSATMIFSAGTFISCSSEEVTSSSVNLSGVKPGSKVTVGGNSYYVIDNTVSSGRSAVSENGNQVDPENTSLENNDGAPDNGKDGDYQLAATECVLPDSITEDDLKHMFWNYGTISTKLDDLGFTERVVLNDRKSKTSTNDSTGTYTFTDTYPVTDKSGVQFAEINVKWKSLLLGTALGKTAEEFAAMSFDDVRTYRPDAVSVKTVPAYYGNDASKKINVESYFVRDTENLKKITGVSRYSEGKGFTRINNGIVSAYQYSNQKVKENSDSKSAGTKSRILKYPDVNRNTEFYDLDYNENKNEIAIKSRGTGLIVNGVYNFNSREAQTIVSVSLNEGKLNVIIKTQGTLCGEGAYIKIKGSDASNPFNLNQVVELGKGTYAQKDDLPVIASDKTLKEVLDRDDLKKFLWASEDGTVFKMKSEFSEGSPLNRDYLIVTFDVVNNRPSPRIGQFKKTFIENLEAIRKGEYTKAADFEPAE